jgi:hypothetical protein
MDQRQASAHATWLNLEHPDRAHFEWVALARTPGKWAVVRMVRRKRVDPLKATTEAVPKPPYPDHPSSGPLGDLPYG